MVRPQALRTIYFSIEKLRLSERTVLLKNKKVILSPEILYKKLNLWP